MNGGIVSTTTSDNDPSVLFFPHHIATPSSYASYTCSTWLRKENLYDWFSEFPESTPES